MKRGSQVNDVLQSFFNGILLVPIAIMTPRKGWMSGSRRTTGKESDFLPTQQQIEIPAQVWNLPCEIHLACWVSRLSPFLSLRFFSSFFRRCLSVSSRSPSCLFSSWNRPTPKEDLVRHVSVVGFQFVCQCIVNYGLICVAVAVSKESLLPQAHTYHPCMHALSFESKSIAFFMLQKEPGGKW